MKMKGIVLTIAAVLLVAAIPMVVADEIPPVDQNDPINVWVAPWESEGADYCSKITQSVSEPSEDRSGNILHCTFDQSRGRYALNVDEVVQIGGASAENDLGNQIIGSVYQTGGSSTLNIGGSVQIGLINMVIGSNKQDGEKSETCLNIDTLNQFGDKNCIYGSLNQKKGTTKVHIKDAEQQGTYNFAIGSQGQRGGVTYLTIDSLSQEGYPGMNEGNYILGSTGQQGGVTYLKLGQWSQTEPENVHVDQMHHQGGVTIVDWGQGTTIYAGDMTINVS